jgi:hypothetical protein
MFHVGNLKCRNSKISTLPIQIAEWILYTFANYQFLAQKMSLGTVRSFVRPYLVRITGGCTNCNLIQILIQICTCKFYFSKLSIGHKFLRTHWIQMLGIFWKSYHPTNGNFTADQIRWDTVIWSWVPLSRQVGTHYILC